MPDNPELKIVRAGPKTLKAIDTYWNGHYFRSRLEARWAVFYDYLGIPYEYEKEGYDLGNGVWYLPDFWLPEQKCFTEIKPDLPQTDEIRKVSRLSVQSGFPVYVACRQILCWDSIRKVYPSLGQNEFLSDEFLNPHICFGPGAGGFPDVEDGHQWKPCDCHAGFGISFGNVDLEHNESRCSSTHDVLTPKYESRLFVAYRIAATIRFEEVHKPEWDLIDVNGKKYARRCRSTTDREQT